MTDMPRKLPVSRYFFIIWPRFILDIHLIHVICDLSSLILGVKRLIFAERVTNYEHFLVARSIEDMTMCLLLG